MSATIRPGRRRGEETDIQEKEETDLEEGIWRYLEIGLRTDGRQVPLECHIWWKYE